MKVAIKFCGGCDPTYDRVELVRRIKDAAGNSIEWVNHREHDCETVLLVCGCLKACPEDTVRHDSLLLLKQELSPEYVVARLRERGLRNANYNKR